MEQLGISWGGNIDAFFFQFQVFYIHILCTCRQFCQVDLNWVQKMSRVCFVVNLGKFRFKDTLNDFFIEKMNRNGSGYDFTGNQCLEIQSQYFFAHWVIIDIFNHGVYSFSLNIQGSLCAFFCVLHKTQCFFFFKFQSNVFFHFLTI